MHPILDTSTSEFIQLRGLRYHIRHWGNPSAPLLVCLHGWMDVSATFQFIADHLEQSWHLIAPDWQGFGLSEKTNKDSYWFYDYIADLEALVNHYSPQQSIRLVGHSMGGNIAAVYAGLRPNRIESFANLEGFGLPVSRASDAPKRLTQWLDELQTPPKLRDYTSLDEVSTHLRRIHPNLTSERADFLAAHWAAHNPQTKRFELRADIKHKHINPYNYRLDEMLACWKQITCPVLWLTGNESSLLKQVEKDGNYHERMQAFNNLEAHQIEAAGHMLHLDQPEQTAQLIHDFMQKHHAIVV